MLAVLVVDETRQVEQLGALIDLSPEAMLKLFLGLFELLAAGDEVHVGEDAHDARKAVHLAYVEKLKGLHLEAEAGVYHEQDEVGTFGCVDHGTHCVLALVEGEATIFASHHGDGAFDVVDFLARIVANKVLHEKGLAYFGGSHYGYENGRWLKRAAVYFGQVQTLGFDILSSKFKTYNFLHT